MEVEESSSIRLEDDIENLGSQNPSIVVLPGQTPEKTHLLKVKQRQNKAYGSDDYEVDVHQLYLSPGENALILKQTTEPSVLMDTQEETNSVVSYILSFERTGGDFTVTSDQYLYFDVTSDNIVTIKDFRTPPSSSSSDSSVAEHSIGPADSVTQPRASFSMVGIASQESPSHFEELPLRQLRILMPGDRICTNLGSDPALGDFVLEYTFGDRPKKADNPPSPYEKNSLGLLTQPLDEDSEDEDSEDEDGQIATEANPRPPAPCLASETQLVGQEASAAARQLGSPPRRPVEELCASLLLTQPTDGDEHEEHEELCANETDRHASTHTQNSHAPTLGTSLHSIEPPPVMDHGDEDSENTVEMTQHIGMMMILPQTSQATTDPVVCPTVKEEGEDITDDDSETTLGEDDQLINKVEARPPETIILNGQGNHHHHTGHTSIDVAQSTTPAADTEDPQCQSKLPASDNPKNNTEDNVVVIGQEASVKNSIVENSDDITAGVSCPDAAMEKPTSDVTAQTEVEREPLVGNITRNLPSEAEAKMDSDGDPGNKSSDRQEARSPCQSEEEKDCFALSPEVPLGVVDLLESSRESQSPQGLAYLSPSQTQIMKIQDSVYPVPGTVLPISNPCDPDETQDAAENNSEKKPFSRSDDPSPTLEVGRGCPKEGTLGCNDSYESPQNVECASKSIPQNVLMPRRNVLASPSQDVSLSLLRETGSETPDATDDAYQNTPANAEDEVTKEQHDADDNNSCVDEEDPLPDPNVALNLTNADASNVPKEFMTIRQRVEDTKGDRRASAEEMLRRESRGDVEASMGTQDDGKEPAPLEAMEVEAVARSESKKRSARQALGSTPASGTNAAHIDLGMSAQMAHRVIDVHASRPSKENQLDNAAIDVETTPPTKVEDTAKGRAREVTEIDDEQPIESSITPGDGCTLAGDTSDEDISEVPHDRTVKIDKKGLPSSPTLARTLTNAEAHAIAKLQMTLDKTRVEETIEHKKKLDEEIALRRQVSGDHNQDSVRRLSIDSKLPPKPRSGKRLAEDGSVSPPASAVKRRRMSSRKTTPESSSKSVSTLATTPRSTRKTRKSLQGLALEDVEEVNRISIMGTQANLDREMIEKLGGTLYENIGDASKATHLIVDIKDDGSPKLIRTPKFMIAVARGCDIVHINFYKDSINQNEFLNEENYFIWNMKDMKVKCELKAFEKKYKFRLQESIARARKFRKLNRFLLSGTNIYICPGVAGKNDKNNRTPIASEFRAILEGAGATVIKALPESLEIVPKTIIITSKVDKEAAQQKKTAPVKRALEEQAVEAMTTVEIFDAIMSQILPLVDSSKRRCKAD